MPHSHIPSMFNFTLHIFHMVKIDVPAGVGAPPLDTQLLTYSFLLMGTQEAIWPLTPTKVSTDTTICNLVWPLWLLQPLHHRLPEEHGQQCPGDLQKWERTHQEPQRVLEWLEQEHLRVNAPSCGILQTQDSSQGSPTHIWKDSNSQMCPSTQRYVAAQILSRACEVLRQVPSPFKCKAHACK